MVNAQVFVYLRVKFRFMGVDFGKVEQRYKVKLANSGISFEEWQSETPEGAQTLFNKRGVLLKVW